MYSKVIVLEIKSTYCLAITDEGIIIRIKKKDNIKVGDRLYVLEEDFYHKENKVSIATSFLEISRKTFLRASSVAAAIIICFSTLLTIQKLNTNAYAAISIDATSDLQIKLNNNYKVVSAVSYDNTIPKKELKKMLGQKLIDIKPEILSLFGSDSESLLIGYVMNNNSTSLSEKYIEDYFFNLFPHEKTLYIKGIMNDFNIADQQQMSIGLYLASKCILDDKFEAVWDDMDMKQILNLLKKQPDLMVDKNVREALESKWEEIYKQDIEDDNSDSDDSDDIKNPYEKNEGENPNSDRDDSHDTNKTDMDDSEDKKTSSEEDDNDVENYESDDSNHKNSTNVEDSEDKKKSSEEDENDDLKDINTTNLNDSDD